MLRYKHKSTGKVITIEDILKIIESNGCEAIIKIKTSEYKAVDIPASADFEQLIN